VRASRRYAACTTAATRASEAGFGAVVALGAVVAVTLFSHVVGIGVILCS
jgi:hypothetical protein